MRLRWVPWALGTWIMGSLLLILFTVPFWSALMLTAAVLVQALAGMVLWHATVGVRATAPRDRLELWGMGVALGSGLAVVCGVLVDLVLPGWPGWLMPAVIAAGYWFWPARASGDSGTWVWRRGSSVAGGVGLVIGLLGIRLNLAQYPLTWAGSWAGYHRDMLFFEALSTSIARYGPMDSIFMSGAEVRYHWLAYGWAGQLAEAFGTEPFVVLTRVLPVMALAGLIALVASWAGSRSPGWRVPLLAVLLVVAGGYLGAANGTLLNFDSPSESVSGMWLVALLVAFLSGIAKPLNRTHVGVVMVLGALVAGGKISAAAVGLAGTGLVAVALSLRRDEAAKRAWVLVAAAAVGVIAAFVLLIAGTATGGTLQVLSVQARAAYVQGLVLDKSPLGIAAGTVALLLAIAARWGGLAWLVGSRRRRWQPETVLGVGLVIASVVPVVVLSEGVSETWFALAASAPLAVISAIGLGEVWHRLQSRLALALSILAAGGVLVAVTFLWAQGEPTTASARFWGPPVGYALSGAAGLVIALTARAQASRRLVWAGSFLTVLVLASAAARLIPIAADFAPKVAVLSGPIGNFGTDLYIPAANASGPVPSAVLDEAGLAPDRTSWTQEFAAAGERLFGLTTGSDVVVTNDSTSFLVPALGRRLTYMSGVPYQWQYGSSGTVGGIPERVRLSEAFVDNADPTAFAELCRAGVTWLWASHDLTDRRDWQPFAVVEFANDEVSLARLDRTQCP